MQFTLSGRFRGRKAHFIATGIATLLLATMVASHAAKADPAYIAQFGLGSVVPHNFHLGNYSGNGGNNGPQYQGHTNTFKPAPEFVPPTHGNLAATLQIGSFNNIFQLQHGTGNTSIAGTIGSHDNLGVVQDGNQLFSNVWLLGTGLKAWVIQPPGAAPLNMLIARLPNGSLLIKH